MATSLERQCRAQQAALHELERQCRAQQVTIDHQRLQINALRILQALPPMFQQCLEAHCFERFHINGGHEIFTMEQIETIYDILETSISQNLDLLKDRLVKPFFNFTKNRVAIYYFNKHSEEEETYHITLPDEDVRILTGFGFGSSASFHSIARQLVFEHRDKFGKTNNQIFSKHTIRLIEWYVPDPDEDDIVGLIREKADELQYDNHNEERRFYIHDCPLVMAVDEEFGLLEYFQEVNEKVFDIWQEGRYCFPNGITENDTVGDGILRQIAGDVVRIYMSGGSEELGKRDDILEAFDKHPQIEREW